MKRRKAHRLLDLRVPTKDVPYARGPNSAAGTRGGRGSARDAGGGDELPVVHPGRHLDPGDAWALIGDPLEERLVGGRAPAIEEARAREERGAGADGGHDLRLGGALREPVEQRPVLDLLARADPARDEEQVQVRAVGEAVIRHLT